MKKRPRAHIVDSRGGNLFKEALPDEWVLREYGPDYGIDLSVEVFDLQEENFVTLGEHFYVQLKSTRNVKIVSKEISRRCNVEKTHRTYDRELLGEMSVISVSLETEELQLARSMGPAAPIVLVLADVEGSRVYWVCLNDFVEKVLIPEVGEDQFLCQKSHTVHVPCSNCVDVSRKDHGVFIPLRFLARRAKLYAAFNRFRYQRLEIASAYARWVEDGPVQHQRDHPDFLRLANHFLESTMAYDFWKTTYAWRAIELTHVEVAKTAASVRLAMKNREAISSWEERCHIANDIQTTFGNLANLGNMFEEICREWFLPTALGALAQEEVFG